MIACTRPSRVVFLELNLPDEASKVYRPINGADLGLDLDGDDYGLLVRKRDASKMMFDFAQKTYLSHWLSMSFEHALFEHLGGAC